MQESPASPAAPPQPLDPRLKLVLTLGFGLLLWYGGPWGQALIGSGLVLLHLRQGLRERGRLRLLRAGALFALFWTLAACLLGLWQGLDWLPALERGFWLGLRLFLLLLLGLALALGSSARELGLGLSWYLRPFLRERAWLPALALALMLHFLPLTLQTLFTVRRMDALRAPQRPLWLRWSLQAQTALRVLAQSAWQQTMALAARGLDSPEAWQPRFAPQPGAWMLGLLLLALGTGAALC